MASDKATTDRPVQLQANLAGAWKTVLHFDAGDEDAHAKVEEGARLLHEACPKVAFRIATAERSPAVLRYIGKSTYGVWMSATRA